MLLPSWSDSSIFSTHKRHIRILYFVVFGPFFCLCWVFLAQNWFFDNEKINCTRITLFVNLYKHVDLYFSQKIANDNNGKWKCSNRFGSRNESDKVLFYRHVDAVNFPTFRKREFAEFKSDILFDCTCQVRTPCALCRSSMFPFRWNFTIIQWVDA